MADIRPFYEIYLALGLVALLWVILRVDLASQISARLDDWLFASPGSPGLWNICLALLRLWFGIAVFVISVLSFWPVLLGLGLTRRRDRPS